MATFVDPDFWKARAAYELYMLMVLVTSYHKGTRNADGYQIGRLAMNISHN